MLHDDDRQPDFGLYREDDYQPVVLTFSGGLPPPLPWPHHKPVAPALTPLGPTPEARRLMDGALLVLARKMAAGIPVTLRIAVDVAALRPFYRQAFASYVRQGIRLYGKPETVARMGDRAVATNLYSIGLVHPHAATETKEDIVVGAGHVIRDKVRRFAVGAKCVLIVTSPEEDILRAVITQVYSGNPFPEEGVRFGNVSVLGDAPFAADEAVLDTVVPVAVAWSDGAREMQDTPLFRERLVEVMRNRYRAVFDRELAYLEFEPQNIRFTSVKHTSERYREQSGLAYFYVMGFYGKFTVRAPREELCNLCGIGFGERTTQGFGCVRILTGRGR